MVLVFAISIFVGWVMVGFFAAMYLDFHTKHNMDEIDGLALTFLGPLTLLITVIFLVVSKRNRNINRVVDLFNYAILVPYKGIVYYLTFKWIRS